MECEWQKKGEMTGDLPISLCQATFLHIILEELWIAQYQTYSFSQANINFIHYWIIYNIISYFSPSVLIFSKEIVTVLIYGEVIKNRPQK